MLVEQTTSKNSQHIKSFNNSDISNRQAHNTSYYLLKYIYFTAAVMKLKQKLNTAHMLDMLMFFSVAFKMTTYPPSTAVLII
jgi:hypothetical protein